jgi:hypothetical protein
MPSKTKRSQNRSKKTSSTAGYSGTPLGQKLGIKPGSTLHVVGAPPGYLKLLSPLPDGVKFGSKMTAATDLVQVFATDKARLQRVVAAVRLRMRPDAVIWVSWPKKASAVATNITEDVVRDVAFPLGLVDIKVCAVDATWSGLKLVIRKALRN